MMTPKRPYRWFAASLLAGTMLAGCMFAGDVFVSSAALAAPGSSKVTAPKTSVKETAEYQRLLLTWPDRVTLNAAANGNTITLRFDRASALNPADIRAKFGNRVTGARLSKDGKTLTLTTDKAYRIRSFVSGTSTGIDLLVGSGKPVAKADDAAKDTADAEKAKAAKAKEEKAKEEKLKAEKAKAEKAKAEKAKIEKAKAEKEKAEKTKIDKAKKEAASKDKAAKETAAQDKATKDKIAKEQAAKEKETKEKAAKEKAAAEKTAKEQAAKEQAEKEKIEKANIEKATQEAQEKAATEKTTTDKAEATQALAKATAADTAQPANSNANADAAASTPSTKPPYITLTGSPEAPTIEIGGAGAEGLAVFKRGDVVWVVSARKGLELVPPPLPFGPVTAVAQPKTTQGSAFTFTVAPGTALPAIRWDDAEKRWLVVLNMAAASTTPSLQLQNANGQIRAPMAHTTAPITVTDPDIGDTLVALPATAPTALQQAERRFLDFTVLPSAQGLAVVQQGDGVSVRGENGTVVIASGVQVEGAPASDTAEKSTAETAPQTPAAAADAPATAQAEPPATPQETAPPAEQAASAEAAPVVPAEATATPAGSTLFPYAAWALPEGQSRKEMEHTLWANIASGDAARADPARKRLAEWMLAERDWVGAMGVLQRLKDISPQFFAAEHLDASLGLAQFMLYRLNDAQRSFAAETVKDLPEMALWANINNGLLGVENTPAWDFNAQFERYIQLYPPPVIERLAILAADSAINRKDYAAANAILDTLKNHGPSKDGQIYSDFLRAKILAETGQTAPAISIWQSQTKNLDDRFIRARAEYSLINLQLQLGKITRDEAISRLDKLRIVWRGDSLEMNLLELLSRLYVDAGDYGNALRVLKEIVTHFPNTNEALNGAARMGSLFSELFNKGKADSLSPLEALGLYYEFRELTPIGAEGDKMIQGLADRLAKVDLLDRAAALLNHQVRFRVEKEERSRVGAQLALLYLLNRQPDQTLDALAISGYGNNSAALQTTRDQLAAEAFLALKKPAEALNAARRLDSRAAELLRGRIYWEAKDWKNVISTYEQLLGTRENVAANLTPEESEGLMRLALAYAFTRDRAQLQYLKDYFSPLLTDENQRNTLAYLVDTDGEIDPKRFAEMGAELGKIQTFLQDFRTKLQEGGLSQAVQP